MLFGTLGKGKFPFTKWNVQIVMDDKCLIFLGRGEMIKDFFNGLTGQVHVSLGFDKGQVVIGGDQRVPRFFSLPRGKVKECMEEIKEKVTGVMTSHGKLRVFVAKSD